MSTLTEAWGDLVDRTQFLYDDVPAWFGDYAGFAATTLSDRADGKFYPVYQTEQDLAIQRAQARALCGITRIHDGAVDAMANYIFGSGFGFKVTCDADTAPGLVDRLQAIVDEFLESNSFAGDLDREIHRRSREDGEAFARLRWGASGSLRVQVLEPDQITEPADPRRIEEWEGLCGCDDPPLSWTFGVAADASDSSDVVGYYCRTLDGMDWEFLRPCHVEHFRRNVPRNAKRGVTDFYGIFRDLVSEAKLRNNSTTGAAVQAAIAWIVQHAPGVTSSQAAGIGTAAAVGTYQQPAALGGTNTRNAVKNPPGTILRVGAGQQFMPGPMGAERNAGFVEIAQYALRAIGQRWSCPEYIISGDASNANYASSLVAESPFVKARQADQQWYSQRFVSLIWKAIEMHWRRGVFDRWGVTVEQMRHWCDIVVNFPSVESRDPLKIAQTAQVLDGLGVISPATIATQHGLDLDEEIRQGAKKPAPPPSQFGRMPGLPGMPPQPMAPEMLAQQEKLKGGEESTIVDSDKPGLTAAVEAALESVRTSAEARAILEQLTKPESQE